MPSSRSKTQQIIAAIESDIAGGRLKPGDRIPSARELRKQFATSATPVRDAINHLKSRGVLEGEPGVGVFVTAHPPIGGQV